MATQSMIYRRLDDNWDMTFGNGKGCYLSSTEAVAQAVRSRLLLFLQEWWMNLNEGLPMWQMILGAPSSGAEVVLDVIDRLIVDRITGTPYVTTVNSMDSSYDRNTRAYAFTATIDTAFGAVTVSTVPFAPGLDRGVS